MKAFRPQFVLFFFSRVLLVLLPIPVLRSFFSPSFSRGKQMPEDKKTFHGDCNKFLSCFSGSSSDALFLFVAFFPSSRSISPLCFSPRAPNRGYHPAET